MLQVPIVQVVYHISNSYALKKIVDVFSSVNLPQVHNLVIPVVMFLSVVILQEFVCRCGQWAFLKSQPYIRREITARIYDYIQNHSYSYFQNNPAGVITSKIRGITQGYDSIFEDIWYKVANPLMLVVFGILSLAFINIDLFIVIVFWGVIFFTVGIKFSLGLSRRSKIAHDMKHRVVGLISDNISNIFTILLYGKRSHEVNKIRNIGVEKKEHDLILYDFKFAVVGGVLYFLMLSFVLIYTIYLRYINKITTGDFAFVMSIIYFVVNNIWLLVGRVSTFFDHLGSFKSAFSVIATKQDIIDKKDAKDLFI
jgi:ATP-binding cassette subfamily B protein